MIPRTSIDEANRHLQQLHHRVQDLEVTVHNQHEALQSKDTLLQQRLNEISSAKDQEIEGLSEKLMASERTVSILQEELERKNQQILALQHGMSRLKRVLNFKDDVKDLLKTIEDAEENLCTDEGDTDGLLHFYQVEPNNGSVKKMKKKRYMMRNGRQVQALENGTQPESETPPNIGGKEFYL